MTVGRRDFLKTTLALSAGVVAKADAAGEQAQGAPTGSILRHEEIVAEPLADHDECGLYRRAFGDLRTGRPERGRGRRSPRAPAASSMSAIARRRPPQSQRSLYLTSCTFPDPSWKT